MKALVLLQPGRLAIEEREAPEPGPGEVQVRIVNGGICGSDIHYFLHGGFGTVRMRSPMVLGHEIAGIVERVGAGVTAVREGQRVAVNPSLPCGKCGYCRAGAERQCSDMRFMGSAMRVPHVDGGFRELVVCTQAQAVPVGDAISLAEAAVCEPLSVCLHAVDQAPELSGKRVLVSGFGPIGALTLLAARQAGAEEIAVADIAAGPLALAETLGASAVHDVSDPAALDAKKADRGAFDVVFECAGHPSSVQQAIEVTKPGGTIVQVGMLPDMVQLALNPLVTKEIAYKGTFRFDREFNRAAELIGGRTIDVRPIISDTFSYREAAAAFASAQDRRKSIKVMLDFA
ncbi:L-idonate 5-dehydrogenase [Chelativorans alearense]|uniref:L-idonate 5-dehydrogenase n=1 Tax=Chelativorans alearense TaxID=2681495 RepID=UPI0013D704B5|nr:L-idonate 5-dehydrogenase [Chelativorans alearense]